MSSHQSKLLERRVCPRRQIAAGAVGLTFVAASMLTPLAVQLALAAENRGTAIGLAFGLSAGLGTALHALLRTAGVAHPLGTLLAGGTITLMLGLGYLALLSLSTLTGGELSPLWPVFALGFIVFAACAR